MEVSVSAAFNHINTFVHPQATFIDASGDEEMWAMKAIQERASTLGRTIIEVPANAEQNLMWLTMLDSASLSGKSCHDGDPHPCLNLPSYFNDLSYFNPPP